MCVCTYVYVCVSREQRSSASHHSAGHFRCQAANIIDVVAVVLRLIETKTELNNMYYIFIYYIYNCAVFHLKFRIVCMTVYECVCDRK